MAWVDDQVPSAVFPLFLLHALIDSEIKLKEIYSSVLPLQMLPDQEGKKAYKGHAWELFILSGAEHVQGPGFILQDALSLVHLHL